MSNSKPSLLFVHGALHSSWHWGTFPTALSELGYDVHTVDLVSVGVRPNPPADHLEDVGVVRDALQKLIRREAKKVVIVGHSYGGIVSSCAIEGFEEDIVGMVLLDSLLVPEGVKPVDYTGRAGGGVPREWLRSVNSSYSEVIDPHAAFYNDVSLAEAQPLIDRLRPQCSNVLTREISYAGWKHVRCTFVMCTLAAGLPAATRRQLLEEAGKNTKYPLVVHELEASHTPWLRCEKALVRWVRETAGEKL